MIQNRKIMLNINSEPGIKLMIPFEVSSLMINTRAFSTSRDLLVSDENDNNSEDENAYASDESSLVDATAHLIRSDTVDDEGGNSPSATSEVSSDDTDDIIDNYKDESEVEVDKYFGNKAYKLGGARNIKQERNSAVEDFDEFERNAKSIDDAYHEKLDDLARKEIKVKVGIDEYKREERERLDAVSREEAERLAVEFTEKEGQNKRKFGEDSDKQEEESEQESKHRKVDQQSPLDYVLEKKSTEMPDIFDADGGE
jgi:hypothetical protein